MRKLSAQEFGHLEAEPETRWALAPFCETKKHRFGSPARAEKIDQVVEEITKSAAWPEGRRGPKRAEEG